MEKFFLPIPAKRYFTIGEVSNLCGVKPHVLRYWEQEFKQLRSINRRGNRRYYQHHEVSIIREIRELLYSQGFTIIGARNKLESFGQNALDRQFTDSNAASEIPTWFGSTAFLPNTTGVSPCFQEAAPEIDKAMFTVTAHQGLERVRRELLEIRDLLKSPDAN